MLDKAPGDEIFPQFHHPAAYFRHHRDLPPGLDRTGGVDRHLVVGGVHLPHLHQGAHRFPFLGLRRLPLVEQKEHRQQARQQHQQGHQIFKNAHHGIVA
ncbi:MAG: hypothetical protein U5J62_01155 [Desulfurivibrio sp.]|nr:hypothetical protein [Desulfurivibrio sp.]